MKAILTLLIVLFFGAMALAQNTENNVELETYKMDLVLDNSTTVLATGIEISKSEQNQVVRLHKFKNSRVKKALSFTIKINKAKMA